VFGLGVCSGCIIRLLSQKGRAGSHLARLDGLQSSRNAG
jgi:hypothetical protein